VGYITDVENVRIIETYQRLKLSDIKRAPTDVTSYAVHVAPGPVSSVDCRTNHTRINRPYVNVRAQTVYEKVIFKFFRIQRFARASYPFTGVCYNTTDTTQYYIYTCSEG